MFDCHFFSRSIIICRAKSKNTILAFAFCFMSLCTLSAISLMGMMFASLINLANLFAKASSSYDM